ncbi:MAG: NAD(P)H-dependent oxidoreductase subunit E [Candidatus Marinimicrobia bacterium]|nr:NAD(P)H-dependent oxidoreductase subunit E [Candidatus Neomarinimicrobiota bacterium]MCK4445593.1 NAD(P)H-dependent oxidoreductase subunit E [Candidatus Neomarinimicrobiota bacterium]
MKTEDIEAILEKYSVSRGGLISILQGIQSKYGYLPEKSLNIVSEKTGRSLVDIYGVATFYKSFRLKPRGKHLISVCLGTACHVRGGPVIAEEFERQLEIKAGETTHDKEFTLQAVNCLGACALGPIVVVDGHYFSNVNTTKVKQIINKAREGLDKVEIKTDERIFPVEVSCPRCNHSLMDPFNLIDGYPSIRVTTSFGRKHGWLRLSCLYGSYNTEVEYEIPEDTVRNFFCPHCHAELIGVTNCPNCDAPMVSMIVRGGGMIQICSRRGCKEHKLDLNGINF